MRTAHAAQAHAESPLNDVGLSLAKLAALSALKDAGKSLPLGQLADRLSCVKSNITQLADRLEADGFINRAPDPTDRRSRLAVLTTEGRRACDEGIPLHARIERDLFGELSEAEAQQLAALLDKVAARAQ
jgi:DNA-binding MarR family transcriptional regulator